MFNNFKFDEKKIQICSELKKAPHKSAPVRWRKKREKKNSNCKLLSTDETFCLECQPSDSPNSHDLKFSLASVRQF